MTIAIVDGNGGTSSTSSTVTFTQAAGRAITLTANNLVYVSVFTNTAAGAVTVSSISSSAGLTYNLRKRFAWTAALDLEVWYAQATSSGSEKPTANLSGAADNAIIEASSISGYNIASPFDANVSIPATNSAGTGAPTATISTSNANDMIFSTEVHLAFSLLSAGTGYTIQQQLALGGATGTMETMEKVVSSTLSSSAEAWGSNAASSWAVIWDAIQAATSIPYFPAEDTTSVVPILFRKTEVVGY